MGQDFRCVHGNGFSFGLEWTGDSMAYFGSDNGILLVGLIFFEYVDRWSFNHLLKSQVLLVNDPMEKLIVS